MHDQNGNILRGNIVDVVHSRIYPGRLEIEDGKIAAVTPEQGPFDTCLIPGFVDAHFHVESSMLPPVEMARIAAIHGTVATVSDPHEIANVLGSDGVLYMIENSRYTPMKICFSAPSCVPATPMETSGAVLDAEEIDRLLARDDITYLGEMMNFPGVIRKDPEVMQKIAAARKRSKVVDGHAPGLRGPELAAYAAAGITTNHECLSYDETLEDIQCGILVQIRHGSAASILEHCYPLIESHSDRCMFCTDDKHPDDLLAGHINVMVKNALHRGIDPLKVIRVASLNPVRHYDLDVGLLQVGDDADFLEIDNLRDLNILGTYIRGQAVARGGMTLLPRHEATPVNNFHAGIISPGDIRLRAAGRKVHVIEAVDGQVATGRSLAAAREEEGSLVSDTARDILKIVVVNRYRNAPPAVGFVGNFGLKQGAIASSVAHDSHNIVAVGVRDEEIAAAVNAVIESRGAISAISGNTVRRLPLPIAGLMSDGDFRDVAREYTALDRFAKSLGSGLRAPFMTLSFMSLSVIPKLKLTDRGLFDGELFKHISVFAP